MDRQQQIFSRSLKTIKNVTISLSYNITFTILFLVTRKSSNKLACKLSADGQKIGGLYPLFGEGSWVPI